MNVSIQCGSSCYMLWCPACQMLVSRLVPHTNYLSTQYRQSFASIVDMKRGKHCFCVYGS